MTPTSDALTITNGDGDGLGGMEEGRDRMRDGRGRWIGEDEVGRFLRLVGPRRVVGSDPFGCPLWLGPVTDDGYPVLRLKRDGRWIRVPAHRYAWELRNGPVPAGYTIDHRCHTDDLSCPGGRMCLHRRCTDSDHLEPVTRGDNQRRRWERERAMGAAS